MSEFSGPDNLVMFPSAKNFRPMSTQVEDDSFDEVEFDLTEMESELPALPTEANESNTHQFNGEQIGESQASSQSGEEAAFLKNDSLDEQWDRVKNFRPHGLREKLMVLDLKLELLSKIQRKSSFYLSETLTNLPENQQ
jgi:hypothetical protein